MKKILFLIATLLSLDSFAQVQYRVNLSKIKSAHTPGDATSRTSDGNYLFVVQKSTNGGAWSSLSINAMSTVSISRTSQNEGSVEPSIKSPAPFYFKGRTTGVYSYQIDGNDNGNPFSLSPNIEVTIGNPAQLISDQADQSFNAVVGDSLKFSARLTDFYDNRIAANEAKYVFATISGSGTWSAKTLNQETKDAESTLTLNGPGPVFIEIYHENLIAKKAYASVSVSCKEGTHQEGAECVPDVRTCSIPYGSGEETWNGSGYGSCVAKSCHPSFHLSGNACESDVVSCSVQNGAGSKTYSNGQYGECIVSSCYQGFHAEGNLCKEDSRDCSVQNGNGTQSWTGSAYGECVIASCLSGYHIEDNQCKSNVKSCPVDNGSGTQSWSGSSYGSCIASSCNSGYSLNTSANSCVMQSQSCPISNGTGTQSYDPNFGNFGECKVASCNSGYAKEGNACVDACSTASFPCTEQKNVDGQNRTFFKIYSLGQMKATANTVSVSNKNYALKADLDLSSVTGYLYREFMYGILDGEGHTIYGKTGNPLFMFLMSSKVYNLKLEHFNINMETSSLAALASMSSVADIKNVHLKNSAITGNSSAYSVGGIIGELGSSQIEGSGVYDTQIIGGTGGILVGKVWESPIRNSRVERSSFKSGSTINSEGTGAITGYSSGPIENVHAEDVTMSGKHAIGGLVGIKEGPTSVSTLINSTALRVNVTSAGGNNVGGAIGDLRNGTVKDVLVKDSQIESTSSIVGGFSGKTAGIAENVSVVNTSVTGSNVVGGITGILTTSGTIKSPYIENNTVTAPSNVGPIFGVNWGGVIIP